MAKTYILSATRRPFTVHDPKWNLICMLCTQLPTIENGLAMPERTPEGKQGIAVTFTIRLDATWGDGTPVSTKDVDFTWRVGRHKQTGVSGFEFYKRVYKINIKNDKTFTLHMDKLFFDYNSIGGFELLPAHLEEHIFKSSPVEYRNRTTFDTDTTHKASISALTAYLR